jgi:hypothetical protein
MSKIGGKTNAGCGRPTGGKTTNPSPLRTGVRGRIAGKSWIGAFRNAAARTAGRRRTAGSRGRIPTAMKAGFPRIPGEIYFIILHYRREGCIFNPEFPAGSVWVLNLNKKPLFIKVRRYYGLLRSFIDGCP